MDEGLRRRVHEVLCAVRGTRRFLDRYAGIAALQLRLGMSYKDAMEAYELWDQEEEERAQEGTPE